MRRALVCGLVVAVGSALAAPLAHAGAIVWRSTTSTAIWESAQDGSAPHVIAHGSAPYISPDATHLAYGNTANQLTLTDLADPTKATRVIAGAWGGFATWSPNGHRLGAQVGTSLIDLTAGGTNVITLAHADHGWLAFNPASTRIALDGYNDTTNQPDLPLQTMSIAGGRPTALQHRSPGATGICWGATNVIAFAVSNATSPVFTELVTPGATATIGARSAFDTYPDGWSADGSRLLIEEDEPDGVHIGYLTMATHKITLLKGAYRSVQGMSRDGTRALVGGGSGANRFVAVISLNDGRRLVTLHHAVDPSWTG